MPPSNRRHFCL